MLAAVYKQLLTIYSAVKLEGVFSRGRVWSVFISVFPGPPLQAPASLDLVLPWLGRGGSLNPWWTYRFRKVIRAESSVKPAARGAQAEGFSPACVMTAQPWSVTSGGVLTSVPHKSSTMEDRILRLWHGRCTDNHMEKKTALHTHISTHLCNMCDICTHIRTHVHIHTCVHVYMFVHT